MLLTIFGDHKSNLKPGKVYCWTNSIRDGRGILLDNRNREIIIKSLRRLVWEEKLKVYAFVLMPNHIHLVLETFTEAENVPEIFRAETSDLIIDNLKVSCPELIRLFDYKKGLNRYRIWRKSPKLIELGSSQQIEEALEYVHENPAFDRWGLVKASRDFKWSSAKYYQSGIDTFGFITNYFGHDEKSRGMA